jgi:CRP/FNR family transcriptional regulator, cyclic AMP receptor protein
MARRSASSFFDYDDPQGVSRERVITFLPDRDERDWQILLGYTELRRCSPGDVVIRRGDSERAIYLLTAGSLGLRQGPGEPVFKTIDAPSVVGEVAFLDGAARSADLVAQTEGELRRLTLEAFESLSARHPELGRAILFELGRITATRLRWLTDRVAQSD